MERTREARFRQREQDGYVSLGTSTSFGGTPTIWACSQPYREYCNDTVGKAPYHLDGGDFQLRRTQIKRGLTRPVTLAGGGQRSYSGVFCSGFFGANLGYDDLPLEPAADNETMTAWGAKGWNKFKPGSPGVNLGQTLGELWQFPTLPGRAIARAFMSSKKRDVQRLLQVGGSEYLNTQFGWIPLLSDLRGIYKTQQNLAKTLSQLKRDNGKGIRRKGVVSMETATEFTNTEHFSCFYPILTSEFYGPKGSRTVALHSSLTYTFSGRFRYWIPDIEDDQWTAEATRALFGLNPSPALLWELLPWSWLIDWFSNVGDVIDNLTNSIDNLTADYAYIMRERTYRSVIHDAQTFANGQTLKSSTEFERTVKQRVPATPYGFGLTYEDLSGRQALILAALGLTRFQFN